MRGKSFRPRSAHRGEESGLTLIEISVSIVVICVFLLACATALTSSLSAARGAVETTDGAIFLEATMEDLSAQAYSDLLSLNGNRIFDGTSASDSRYAVDLAVFLSEANLIQVQADLVDLRSNARVGGVTTLRSSW
jgi:prepilin-type N-terminal cleavage/methylation domain-containing protein